MECNVSFYLKKNRDKFPLLREFYGECHGPEGDTEILHKDLPRLIKEINLVLREEKVPPVIMHELQELKRIAEIGLKEKLHLYGVAD